MGFFQDIVDVFIKYSPTGGYVAEMTGSNVQPLNPVSGITTKALDEVMPLKRDKDGNIEFTAPPIVADAEKAINKAELFAKAMWNIFDHILLPMIDWTTDRPNLIIGGVAVFAGAVVVHKVKQTIE